MTSGVHTATPQEDATEVAHRMLDAGIRHMPVVDDATCSPLRPGLRRYGGENGAAACPRPDAAERGPRDLRISLFLPSHRGWSQIIKNRIRFKKLLRQAEHALRAEGMRLAQIDRVLEPARRLLEDRSPWERPRDGLALVSARLHDGLRLPDPGSRCRNELL